MSSSVSQKIRKLSNFHYDAMYLYEISNFVINFDGYVRNQLLNMYSEEKEKDFLATFKVEAQEYLNSVNQLVSNVTATLSALQSELEDTKNQINAIDDNTYLGGA